jgi:hypothetical protein
MVIMKILGSLRNCVQRRARLDSAQSQTCLNNLTDKGREGKSFYGLNSSRFSDNRIICE